MEELEGVLFLQQGPAVLLATIGSAGVLKVFALTQGRLQPWLACSLHAAGMSDKVMALCGLTHVMYLAALQQVVVVSKEQHITFYSLASLLATADAVMPVAVRTVIGWYGDILDLCLLASQQAAGVLRYRMCVVTNSAVVRVVDERQGVQLLEGHGDIVLGVSSSPDG